MEAKHTPGPLAETFVVGGVTYQVAEVHQRAPRSWNRNRKRLRFDGYELKSPGTFLWLRFDTEKEARDYAFDHSSRLDEDDRRRVMEANRAAIAKAEAQS